MYQLESNRESLVLTSETSRLRIGFVSESIVRVTMTGKQPFQDRASLSVVANSWYLNYRMDEDATEFRVATASVAASVNKKTGAIAYFDPEGRLLTARARARRQMADTDRSIQEPLQQLRDGVHGRD